MVYIVPYTARRPYRLTGKPSSNGRGCIQCFVLIVAAAAADVGLGQYRPAGTSHVCQQMDINCRAVGAYAARQQGEGGLWTDGKILTINPPPPPTTTTTTPATGEYAANWHCSA